MILFFEKFLQFIFCKVRPFTSKIGPMRTILKNRVSSDLNSYPIFTLFKKLQKKIKIMLHMTLQHGWTEPKSLFISLYVSHEGNNNSTVVVKPKKGGRKNFWHIRNTPQSKRVN